MSSIRSSAQLYSWAVNPDLIARAFARPQSLISFQSSRSHIEKRAERLVSSYDRTDCTGRADARGHNLINTAAGISPRIVLHKARAKPGHRAKDRVVNSTVPTSPPDRKSRYRRAHDVHRSCYLGRCGVPAMACHLLWRNTFAAFGRGRLTEGGDDSGALAGRYEATHRSATLGDEPPITRQPMRETGSNREAGISNMAVARGDCESDPTGATASVIPYRSRAAAIG